MPHDPPETIKKAYRDLVMKHHPDLHPGQDSTLILQEINEAFEVLSDYEKKRNYDLLLYNYFLSLRNVHDGHSSATQTEKTRYQAATTQNHQKVYVRKHFHYNKRISDPSSRFIQKKDFIVPLLIIALFTFIAFYIRFKNETYKIEPYKKSTVRIDIYSVNLSGILPSAYLPNDFFEYTQITQLDLSNNRLYYLSPKFGNLKNIKALNLNNNQISHLNDGFSVMKKMVFLNLSNNPLVEFPAEILEMKELEILWLDNCSLTELPLDSMNFPKLQYLFLRGNNISAVHQKQIRKKFPHCYILF
ncbi:MAG: hypothetical protein KatS3mg035_1987 [Bacteroidia bacterium]|nr:MAG: hypothetical protein KatS3mg035_1987 [Bacteroidia bacterium]